MGEEQPVVLYGTLGGERGALVTIAADGSGRLVARSVMVGVDANGDERIVRSEPDGTPRGQVILWDYTGAQQIRAAGEPATGQAMVSLFGRNVSGNLQALENEDTGELRTVLMGWDGAAPVRLLCFADGRLRIALQGTDAGENPENLLVDGSRILRQRNFEPWRWVDTQEPAPGGAYLTVFTVPADCLALVEWRVVSTAGDPLIDVHAVENAGAPDTSNAEVIGASPAVGCLALRDGPLTLHVGGTIQCRNTAAAGNTGNVRVWVELYSTGDVP